MNKVGVRIATQGPRGRFPGRGHRGGATFHRGRGRGGWTGQWQNFNRHYLNYQGQRGFSGGGTSQKFGQKTQKQNKTAKE